MGEGLQRACAHAPVTTGCNGEILMDPTLIPALDATYEALSKPPENEEQEDE